MSQQTIGSLLLYFCTFIILFDFAYALWPIPQQWTKGNTTLKLYPSVKIKLLVNSSSHDTSSVEIQRIFHSAENRFQQYLFQEKYVSPNAKFDICNSPNLIQLIEVEICSDDTKLELGIDESYSLHIPDQEPFTVKITAKTIYGGLHGLTTLSQLIYYDNDFLKHRKHRELYIPFAPHKIIDYPSFSHRGLLLDTSRNYFPLDDILKTIETMSWNKMNVFHWHIVDANSWPVVSRKFPKLSEKGAYDPETMIYTRQDIRIVDEFAKLVTLFHLLIVNY